MGYGELLDAASGLPYDDRRRLAVGLLETLHPREKVEDSAAWRAELSRRVTESRDGVPGVPAEVVLAELDAMLDDAPAG